MKQLVNLTPQQLVFLNHEHKPIAVLPPNSNCNRAMISVTGAFDEYAYIDDVAIPVNKITYGEPSELPEMKDDVLYIVSTLYRTNNPREDLVSPGRLIRDKNGNVIGAIDLSR